MLIFNWLGQDEVQAWFEDKMHCSSTNHHVKGGRKNLFSTSIRLIYFELVQFSLHIDTRKTSTYVSFKHADLHEKKNLPSNHLCRKQRLKKLKRIMVYNDFST